MPTQLHIIDCNFFDPAPRYAAPPPRAPEPSTSPQLVTAQQGGNSVSTAAPVAAPAPAPANNSNAGLWIGAGILVLLFMGKKR